METFTSLAGNTGTNYPKSVISRIESYSKSTEYKLLIKHGISHSYIETCIYYGIDPIRLLKTNQAEDIRKTRNQN